MKVALGEDSLKLHACLTGAFQVLGHFGSNELVSSANLEAYGPN